MEISNPKMRNAIFQIGDLSGVGLKKAEIAIS